MGLYFDENGKYVSRRHPSHGSNLLGNISIPISYTTDSTTLAKEYAVVRRLKQIIPYSGIPSIRPNFIHVFNKPSRLCSHMNRNSSAHYHASPPRICISREFQSQLTAFVNKDEAAALKRPDLLHQRVTGDLAIILIITHELGHNGDHIDMHGKGWKAEFAKLFMAIINDIKSQ